MIKGKTFPLISGTEDGWVWRVRARILETEMFHFKGHFDFKNMKERYWKDGKRYAQEHREAANIKTNLWKLRHPAQYKASKTQWNENNPEKVREMYRRKWNKRKRGLGFIELNSSFEDSHAHHLNKKLVVYVPRELHQSIQHNVWTGDGMREINMAAMQWGYGIGVDR